MAEICDVEMKRIELNALASSYLMGEKMISLDELKNMIV